MNDIITLAHGSGGKAMQELIQSVFVPAFLEGPHGALEDQARLPLPAMVTEGGQLAFTTDSYVVDPLFFPGGDIGMLAVNGTINDLAVGGAKPLYLSCGFILEEGLPIALLRRVVASMARAAQSAQVKIVTGDTKVVQRGQCDKLFINTSGIGIIAPGINVRSNRALPGDVVIVNGAIGNHGAAIVGTRDDLKLGANVYSDTQSLAGLVQTMLAVCPDIHCLRDATRGGVATVLNELAVASQCSIQLEEAALPMVPEVRGVCEILGLDPLYLANEGKLVAVVPKADAGSLLAAMQSHPEGQGSAIIGQVLEQGGAALEIKTAFGARRVLDTLVGEQLPRIC